MPTRVGTNDDDRRPSGHRSVRPLQRPCDAYHLEKRGAAFVGEQSRSPRPQIRSNVHARELLRTRERLNQILAQHCGQPLKRIQDDTERDYIMSAEQGKEYGIIDDVIRKRA